MTALINLEQYTWRYLHTKQPAIKEIDLTIEEGSFVGIIGPNGSGKTSLAYSINGLIPDQYRGIKKGAVNVRGKEVEDYPTGALQRIVGMVFSDPEAQFTAMTVEDELVFGMENLGMSIPEIRERLAWVTDLTGLGPLLEKPPYEISGGQKQRVALAAMLAMTPDVMILDEPTSMLDPVSRRQVFDVLDRLKQEQQNTVIVIEHNLEHLVPLADRMILLYEGEVLLDGETREFFTQMNLLLEKHMVPPGAMRFFYRLLEEGHHEGVLPLTVEEAWQNLRQRLAVQDIQPAAPPQQPDPPPVENTSSNPAEQDPLIEVNEVGFSYPDGTEALRGINLTIQRGEFMALIGQNGSGKTTLSKCINGLFKPTRGDIIVDDLNTRNTSIVQMVRRVGYVFQNPDHQLFNANCWDEIAYGPRNIQLGEDEVAERVEEAVRVVGLPRQYLSEHPFFLPKGLRQRVAIASILALRPEAIIVDEPTTGQDARQSLEIMDFLVDLNREHGHTIIIITHDMPIVARYAERVVTMGQGQILADGPTADVFSNPDVLAQTSLAPPQITQLAQRAQALGFHPGTLTVEEMMDQYQQLVGERP